MWLCCHAPWSSATNAPDCPLAPSRLPLYVLVKRARRGSGTGADVGARHGNKFRQLAQCLGLLGLIMATTVMDIPAASVGADLPSGFVDDVLISGLSNPSTMQFSSDGRIFVAQKGGQIYSFDSAGGSKTLFADLSLSVHDFWDRGLL